MPEQAHTDGGSGMRHTLDIFEPEENYPWSLGSDQQVFRKVRAGAIKFYEVEQLAKLPSYRKRLPTGD